MYEIGVTAQFGAAHRLVGDFGPATRMHGHTYRLDVIVRGEQLQADGTLFNLATLQTAVDALVADLDYHDLADVPWLAGVNTTVEQVAHHCWERIAGWLQGYGLHLLRVQVWESPQSYAAREERLQASGGRFQENEAEG